MLDRKVGIPDPWDINAFLDALEQHRGRQIDLCALSWTLGASAGAWRAYPDHDVIAYSENTSPVHQDAIILHEIGHMIAGHRGRCVLSVEQAHLRAPDLAPAAFVHMLERADAAAEEQEAELTARFVIARIAVQRSRQLARSPLAERVEDVFG
ncbi:ImmA/IrrE family metallo-endopeptidase [Amycolatopsis sp. NPDC059657]|uniref:ImmA/IrrE family metallo-endopeptidase n=1 Tax=Amycolatopsis sp. NPDC059657 TaxID=3346899 RepID=UPI00366DC3A4